MPPKITHTKEKIINAGFEVIREAGLVNFNARTVAKKLGCSTQPVLYHFKTVEELRQEVYKKADAYHTECIMAFHSDNPLLDIGMNYIRFAREEKNLFQLLFQSGGLSGRALPELIDMEELKPLLAILMAETGVDLPDAKQIFRSVCMVAHGYASMLANNMIEIDDRDIASDLEMIFAAGLADRERRENEMFSGAALDHDTNFDKGDL